MNQGGKTIGAWIVVMAATVVALKALDRVPALLAGTPHGARVYASIEEAERAIGARVWLPAYYPDELDWPPASVEATVNEPLVVVVRLAARADGSERLVLAQSIGSPAAPPDAFLPRADELSAAEVEVGRHRARLARVLVGPYERHELRWDQAGRCVTLRYAGPVDTLLSIAASLERRADGSR
jgi:hypothetical protein